MKLRPTSQEPLTTARLYVQPEDGVILTPAIDVPPEKIEWVWRDWIAKKKLHIVAGYAGSGKTTLAMLIMAFISNANSGFDCWPDGSPAIHGSVIFFTTEDGLADTIRPRLTAAGADLKRIHFIQGTIENGRRRSFSFANDIYSLMSKIDAIGDVALVVIDPIVHCVAGDSHKSNEVRAALTPLVEYAEEKGFAILGITHVNKNSSGKNLLDRVTGSHAYSALARMVMFVGKVESSDPEMSNSAVLVRAKSSVGPDDGGYKLRIKPASFQHGHETFESSIVVFEEKLNGSAKDIVQFAEKGGASDNSSAVERAVQFLTELLADGSQLFPFIEEHAATAGIAMSAVKRAKNILGIRSEKQVGTRLANPPTMWVLPSKSVTDQPDATNNGAPKFSRPATSPEHHQSRPARMSDFMGKLSPSARPDVAPVAPVAPADADASTTDQSAAKLNKPLLDLCSNECQRLLDHATSSSDDDALSSVDEIVEAAIKRFVGESAPGNKLIEKYRNALRQLDIFRNLE